MILARVTGSVVATQKNVHLANNRLLVVQPVTLKGEPTGSACIALDVTDAGTGDLVLVMKEGSSARLIFNDPQIPLQYVIVAVVDDFAVAEDLDACPNS